MGKSPTCIKQTPIKSRSIEYTTAKSPVKVLGKIPRSGQLSGGSFEVTLGIIPCKSYYPTAFGTINPRCTRSQTQWIPPFNKLHIDNCMPTRLSQPRSRTQITHGTTLPWDATISQWKRKQSTSHHRANGRGFASPSQRDLHLRDVGFTARHSTPECVPRKPERPRQAWDRPRDNTAIHGRPRHDTNTRDPDKRLTHPTHTRDYYPPGHTEERQIQKRGLRLSRS